MTDIVALKKNNVQVYPKTHIKAIDDLVDATESKSGLMGINDKKIVNNVENGYHLSGTNGVVGVKPNNENFGDEDKIFKNYFRITTVGVNSGKKILKIDRVREGTSLVVCDLLITASKFGGNYHDIKPYSVKVLCLEINGTKEIRSVKLIDGEDDGLISVNWNSSDLEVNLLNEYATCSIEATVFSVESNGLSKITWY